MSAKTVRFAKFDFPMIKNKTIQYILHTSTIKWIYFTRGPNISVLQRYIEDVCVRNSTYFKSNQWLQHMVFCSAIGLTCSTVDCYVCYWLIGVSCKKKKKTWLKKITPSSFEQAVLQNTNLQCFVTILDITLYKELERFHHLSYFHDLWQRLTMH